MHAGLPLLRRGLATDRRAAVVLYWPAVGGRPRADVVDASLLGQRPSPVGLEELDLRGVERQLEGPAVRGRAGGVEARHDVAGAGAGHVVDPGISGELVELLGAQVLDARQVEIGVE